MKSQVELELTVLTNPSKVFWQLSLALLSRHHIYIICLSLVVPFHFSLIVRLMLLAVFSFFFDSVVALSSFLSRFQFVWFALNYIQLFSSEDSLMTPQCEILALCFAKNISNFSFKSTTTLSNSFATSDV